MKPIRITSVTNAAINPDTRDVLLTVTTPEGRLRKLALKHDVLEVVSQSLMTALAALESELQSSGQMPAIHSGALAAPEAHIVDGRVATSAAERACVLQLRSQQGGIRTFSIQPDILRELAAKLIRSAEQLEQSGRPN